MNKLIVCALVVNLFGCSSGPKINGIKYEKDETLSTAGDKSMPQWAEEGELQPWTIKNGKVYSVGITTLRGDERPEAGAKVAENGARANFAKTIENRLEFLFENAEENASLDSTQAKFIGSEASSLTSHSMSIEGHFWKRFAQTQDDGSRHIFYKIYALVTMPEADLKQAIYAAIHKGEATHQLSAGFQKQVDFQWNRFAESKSDSTNEKREPASAKTSE